MRTYKTPIKASELIKKIRSGKYRAKVADVGDAAPYLMQVNVCLQSDHHCSLMGCVGYASDSARDSIDDGRLEAEVAGVVFSRSIVYDDYDIEIGGREIVYDAGLQEGDVLEAAESHLKFPAYDPDDYPFDEKAVLADGIGDLLDDDDSEIAQYAVNAKGEVGGFREEEPVAEGWSPIDRDEALARLAETHQGFEWDW